MGFPKDIEQALSKLGERERVSFVHDSLEAALTKMAPRDQDAVEGLAKQVLKSVPRGMGRVGALEVVGKRAIIEIQKPRG